MYPLGCNGGLHTIITVVSLILGTDSVTYTPDILIGIVIKNTADEPIKLKYYWKS